MGKRFTGIVLALVLSLTAFVQAEKIKLTTLEWEPYIGSKMPGNGFLAEIVIAAEKAAGNEPPTIAFLPWAKAVELAKMGNVNGLLGCYDNPNFKADFILSDPMPCGAMAFLKLKTTQFNYTGKVEELKPYKIGVIADYINTKEIDEATDLTKVVAKDDLANLTNLISGKVDVAIVDPLVAKYFMGKDDVLKPFLDKVEVVEPVLDHKQLFIAFSKKAPNVEATIKTFNDGLQKIRTDGTLDGILKTHKIDDVVKYPAKK
ncbi:MAG: transporter substrate-binding domain-containing protein [Sedimentisphaerales bacterium]|nr:transporter substrate-binding domain-containing protein [Sedimentisphaerales bacterium]MBN2841791.1 transporter substrate-binding domain-containing protein [Sedimentisphaerales bacterium]